MEFGQYLRELRKERSLGVRELARRSGISQGYMSQIETGKRNVKPEMLRKLSRALDVSYLTLLKEIGYLVDDDLKNAVKTEKILTVDLKVSGFDQVKELLTNQQNEIEHLKVVIYDRDEDIDFYVKMLREIDIHIRSSKNPVPYIIETLKGCLPEYHYEFE